jgi:hypothetical protein
MNKFIIAIIAIAIVAITSSCSILTSRIAAVKAEKATEEKTKREKLAIQKPVAGDPVIARWGPALWAEGRVTGIDNGINEAKIAWADGSSPSSVAIADVFQIPNAGGAILTQPGDYTLVKSGTDHWWSEAEIKEVNGTVAKARIINGGEIVNLPGEKIITVTDAVAADIKDSADRQKFLDTAHERRPSAPEGYTPNVGDHILGEWTTNAWYGGRVKSVTDGKALIVWENGMSPDKAVFEKIVPFPAATGSGQEPEIGDFVLLKPTGGNPKAAWVYGQVTSVSSRGIEAKSMDFGTHEYARGEFITLEK